MSGSEQKPLWVKVIGIALAVSMVVPLLLSFVFYRHFQFWQLVTLLVGGVWLFICGFFTTFKPLTIARYFARPGTYDLMLRDRHPTVTRWYFAFTGTILMLIALFMGTAFFVLRNAPVPPTRGQAAHP